MSALNTTFNAEYLPIEMRKAKRWLIWKSEPASDNTKKPRKVPYYPNGARRSGELDSPLDQAKFGNFEEAIKALQSGKFTGLGFALGPDGTGNHWQGIDLDDIPNRPALEHIAKDLPGYTESSPSGKGMHAIGYGRHFASLGSNQSGVEAYSAGRFFTVTAEGVCTNPITCLADFVEQQIKTVHKGSTPLTTATQSGNEFQVKHVSEQTIRDLRSALLFMRADDRGLWVKIGHSLKTLGEVGRGLFMEWSVTSEKFDSQDAAKVWDSFKPSHISYQSIFTEAQKIGWVNPTKSGYSKGTSIDYKTFNLNSFALNGDSEKMEAQMLADKFILGRIAILGQSTVIYAKPNHGKTLLMLWLLIKAIECSDINPDDVFYINADDNHKGATHKLKLAEKHGFRMLVPGYKGFNAGMLAEYLAALIGQGAAHGKVVILDTVKKFTDIMDKKKGSAFGESVRQFVSHGGSVIMLAHTNKHRNAEGNLIFSGTSDLVDDADAAYTLDIVMQEKDSGVRTVKFINFKNRGDNALEEVYEYNYGENRSYVERLASVRAINNDEKEFVELHSTRSQMYERNREAVNVITNLIQVGVNKKTELINAAMDASGLSKSLILRALREHEGETDKEFQFWLVRVEDKNTHVYQLNSLL
jgi:hypothetical protein